VANYSKGEAKLPWRIDWPARWNALGVTVEPFGKDHASPGGSFSTGRRICKEIFGSPAPEPVPYEWINLKGQGAMSSSKGIAIPIDAMVEVIPP
jgi:lysyl-tRNA synthetase class 1